MPRIWERFYSGIAIRMKEATWIGRAAYRWAVGVGLRVAEAELAGQRPSPSLRLAHRIADFLVLDNIKRAIGMHRVRFAGTGAAPIAPDLIKWYRALGVDMREVYGQTENCGLATGMPNRIKLGTVGVTAPHTETKISPEGEILLRGPHVFMGYLNQPEKTAETLRDGWLHTGDVGFLDNEGYLKITDRMKDIIITAGGKNITPSEIERVNQNFARVETIKKFQLLEQQLTAEDDEVTPTMKLKRKFVSEKYKSTIDGMYAEAS